MSSDATEELKFARRFKSIPVVMTTCVWLAHNYERLKASNGVVKGACTIAERVLEVSVHNLVDPFVVSFKSPLNFVDSVACSQLDKVERAFPILCMDTNILLAESKSILLGVAILGHQFLDKIEKSMLESSFAPRPIEAASKPESAVSQEVAVRSYPPLFPRAGLIALQLYRILRHHVELSIRCLVNSLLTCQAVTCAYSRCKRALEDTKGKLSNSGFSISKEKFDLYKEYLDVLMKQFLVQDGRSLEHVNSLEERTKIIIRRNIGNLIMVLQLIMSRVKCLSSYIFGNAIVEFWKKSFCQFSELFYKLPSLSRAQALISKLLTLHSCLLQWMVPNFDAFGVLDELDDEYNSSSPCASSPPSSPDFYIGRRRVVRFDGFFTAADSVRRQYDLIGGSDNSPRSTNTTETPSSLASRLFADKNSNF